MNLELDARQRAMLQEMGVRVWLPQLPDSDTDDSSVAMNNEAEVAFESRATSQNSVQVAATASKPALTPAPTAVTGLPAGIEAMNWLALTNAVAQCSACGMCLGRRAAVLAAPSLDLACDWMVVGDPPDEAQERAGQPFVADAGELLDKMLLAVGVRRLRPDQPAAGAAADASDRAYLTHVLKCRPALMRAPDRNELTTCVNFLRREIALTQPKVILAMGRFAMQVLLSETPSECAKLPLGKLRGQVWRFAGVPVVVTYPPSYLLRSTDDKRKAWADLCLARDVANTSSV